MTLGKLLLQEAQEEPYTVALFVWLLTCHACKLLKIMPETLSMDLRSAPLESLDYRSPKHLSWHAVGRIGDPVAWN